MKSSLPRDFNRCDEVFASAFARFKGSCRHLATINGTAQLT